MSKRLLFGWWKVLAFGARQWWVKTAGCDAGHLGACDDQRQVTKVNTLSPEGNFIANQNLQTPKWTDGQEDEVGGTEITGKGKDGGDSGGKQRLKD